MGSLKPHFTALSRRWVFNRVNARRLNQGVSPVWELFVLMLRQCTHKKLPLLKPELSRQAVPSAANRGADRPWQTDSTIKS